MTTLRLNPQDYFFAGGVESSLLYIGTPTIYAGWGVHAPGLLITKNNLVRAYIGREGVRQQKETWVATAPSVLRKNFAAWKERWAQPEPTLYRYATDASFDWRRVWEEIEKLNAEFWKESYKVEVLDPFAEELEQEMRHGLTGAGVDQALLHELITPAEPTRTQRADVDVCRVKQGALTSDEYARRYWYRNGTWNGGDVLTASMVESLSYHDGDGANEWDQRKKIHEAVDAKLDPKTRQLLGLLRLLTLWREERKAYLQQVNCCLQRVIEHASGDLNVDPEIIRWGWPDEITQMVAEPEVFKQRATMSVLIVDGTSDARIVMAGSDAEKLVAPFREVQDVTEVKGIVASRGTAQGKARIVLGQNDFTTFEEGEVLVTTMTRPEFVPLMRRAVAIVTDEGGLTSHAAIVSRELKKPCVIGTKKATQVFKDGDEVEVDAETGIVRKVPK